MSHLYNRQLLSGFDTNEIESLLENAITYVNDRKDLGNGELQSALVSRLYFRKYFLNSVRGDLDLKEAKEPYPWERCIDLLPTISNTSRYGTQVNMSFSSKIQRSLASTIPPRPIVEIKFEEAVVQLDKLCQNIKEAYQVTSCVDGNNLRVCSPRHTP